MDIKTATIQVLQRAGTALPAKDIAEQIIAPGLWHCYGKTPSATVSVRLYFDIKNNGNKSPFVKVRPLTFPLWDSAEIPGRARPVPAAVHEVPNPSPATAGFCFTDCAQKVLEEFGGNKPMHCKAVTEDALQKDWLVTGANMPEATTHAQVITEIKRHQKRGERGRLVQPGRGYVRLSEWMGRRLAFQIEQHCHQGLKALHERFLTITPGEFAELISQLLAEMGFEMVEVTNLSGDGGIHVRGTLVGARCGPHQGGGPGQEMEVQEQLPGTGGKAPMRPPGGASARSNHHHQRSPRRGRQAGRPARQHPRPPDERGTASAALLKLRDHF